jgi:hypothetical protein
MQHVPPQVAPLAPGDPKMPLPRPNFSSTPQNQLAERQGHTSAPMYMPRPPMTLLQPPPRTIAPPRPPAHPPGHPPPPPRPQQAHFAQAGRGRGFSRPPDGLYGQDQGRGNPGQGRGQGRGRIEALPDMWADPWQEFRTVYPNCEW